LSRWLSVLLWSVIAAAFIGPGTVTTAASAGAGHGLSLLWALAFSTAACFVLQEASARLTLVSGENLAESLRKRYSKGALGILVPGLVVGAVIVGCAAYEAGNILGGVAGGTLALPVSGKILTVLCGLAAAVLLSLGAPRTVALGLSAVVALMGGAFLVTALLLRPSPLEVLQGTFIPSFGGESGMLVLGLIGTTVVPYNLFLGSGLARGQELPVMRFGLGVAVGLGGLISMAVVVVGASLSGPFGFQALADLLGERLGAWASPFFAMGLFAAGFSSAVTAPLAAAVTARGLFDDGTDPTRWHHRSWRYRSVWGGVLLTGVVFGLVGVPPIPVILLAQALNGVLLPFVAGFLILAVNDRRLMGEDHRNGRWANAAGMLVVAITMMLGLRSLVAAATRAFGL